MQARRGPWIEVRSAQGVTGWVHMFDVGTTPVAQGGNFATGALRGLTGLFGGGAQVLERSDNVAPSSRCSRRISDQTIKATNGMATAALLSALNGQPRV